MPTASTAPAPRDIFFALFQATAAAHTAFVVVLTWLRPELGFSGMLGLMVLPFLYFAAGFVPIVLVLTLVRVGLVMLVPALLQRPLLLATIIAIVGIAVASVMGILFTAWLRDEAVVSAVIFGAAVGGVIAGLKLGAERQ